MIFILMGVSGAGKSTVGKILSEKLDCDFYDAEDYHSRKNIEKMSRGIPLTDQDKISWLKSIQGLILSQSDNTVIACSALKQSYRYYLLSVPDKKMFLFILKGIEKRYKNGFNKEQAIMLAPVCSTARLPRLKSPGMLWYLI